MGDSVNKKRSLQAVVKTSFYGIQALLLFRKIRLAEEKCTWAMIVDDCAKCNQQAANL